MLVPVYHVLNGVPHVFADGEHVLAAVDDMVKEKSRQFIFPGQGRRRERHVETIFRLIPPAGQPVAGNPSRIVANKINVAAAR